MDHKALADSFRIRLQELGIDFREYERHGCYAFMYRERKVMFGPTGLVYGLTSAAVRGLGGFELDDLEGFERAFIFLTQPESCVPAIVDKLNIVRKCLVQEGVDEYDIRIRWADLYCAYVTIEGNARYTLSITPNLAIVEFGFVDLPRALYFLIPGSKEKVLIKKYREYAEL